MFKVKTHIPLFLFKSIIAIFLILLISIPAFANSIEEHKSKLDNITEELKERHQELSELESHKKGLRDELHEVENKIKELELELRKLQDEIAIVEEQIAETEKELADAEKRLIEREELLSRRVRAIYENNNISYLEVLFNIRSFSEFLTFISDLKIITQSDYQLLEEVKEERELILLKKEQLEQQKDELYQLEKEAKIKKEILNEQKKEREKLLEELCAEIEAEEEAIRKLEEESKGLDRLIKQLQEEEARRQQEARRGARVSREGGGANDGTENYMGGQLQWPVLGFGPGYITSPYGYRTHPITKARSFHGGIDIGISHSRWPGSPYYNGNPVYAIAAESGTVIMSSYYGGYGNLVVVSHGGGLSTAYAHLHSVMVSNGEQVSRGQPLGIIGSTGFSTGPHLHFEVRVGSGRVNPMPYL